MCTDGGGCRPAVIRAYTAFVALGEPRSHALEAAVVVYRWHHPEVPFARAVQTVLGWVPRGLVH
jgi:hypothetical protein